VLRRSDGTPLDGADTLAAQHVRDGEVLHLVAGELSSLVEQIFTALDTQTVVVPGATAAETILPRLADTLKDLLQQRDQVAKQVEGCSMRTLFPRS
jgi:hypothetical protein